MMMWRWGHRMVHSMVGSMRGQGNWSNSTMVMWGQSTVMMGSMWGQSHRSHCAMVMWGIIKNAMMVGRLYSTMMQGIMRSNSTVMYWYWSNVMVGVMGS